MLEKTSKHGTLNSETRDKILVVCAVPAAIYYVLEGLIKLYHLYVMLRG